MPDTRRTVDHEIPETRFSEVFKEVNASTSPHANPRKPIGSSNPTAPMTMTTMRPIVSHTRRVIGDAIEGTSVSTATAVPEPLFVEVVPPAGSDPGFPEPASR